jgi:uncharacterized protein
MNFPRFFDKINKFIKLHQSILVLGPRGCGKSHYFQGTIKQLPNFITISLLDSGLFSRYNAHPEILHDELASFSQSRPKFGLLIDEIQLVPRLTFEIHKAMEIYGDRLCCILTGSSARKLKRENADLLAGRALRCDFFPLTPEELGEAFQLTRALQRGTLPKVWLSDEVEVAEQYLRTYVSAYLREEVQNEAKVRNLSAFGRFLELAAAHDGKPISYEKIGHAAGVSGPTVKNYYQILIDTLIARELPAWDRSIKGQLMKGSKYYFFDCGVVNALTNSVASEVSPGTYRIGALFENFVINNIVQMIGRELLEIGMYHYRTRGGAEVDVVLQRNATSRPIAIEIKSESAPRAIDISPHMTSFREHAGDCIPLVLCTTPHAYEQGGIRFLPYRDGIVEAVRLARDS